MKDLQSNKLISEFMGLKPNPYNQEPLHPTDFAEDGDKCIKYSAMEYDTWNGLMPVVEKIVGIKDVRGNTRFSVRLFGWWTSILDNHTDSEITAIYGLDKLDTTYRAVVSFIKFYNTQNKKA